MHRVSIDWIYNLNCVFVCVCRGGGVPARGRGEKSVNIDRTTSCFHRRCFASHIAAFHRGGHEDGDASACFAKSGAPLSLSLYGSCAMWHRRRRLVRPARIAKARIGQRACIVHEFISQ
jgi:hypothetical protein